MVERVSILYGLKALMEMRSPCTGITAGSIPAGSTILINLTHIYWVPIHNMNNKPLRPLESDIFKTSFAKFKKIIVEHCSESLTEDFGGDHYKHVPRDTQGRVDVPDVNYDVVKTKGEVSKVIATLSKNYSGAFTNAINKWKAMEDLLSQVKTLEEEIKQEGIRDKIASLFGAEHEFVTRVIKTVSAYEIMLTAQPKAATTVQWAVVWKELSEKLTPELLKVGEQIVKKYSTTQAPKPPSVKFIGEPDVKTEGIGDVWNSFVDKVKNWGTTYDSKLDSVIDKAEKL
jgi:hypothetical protein